MQECRQPEAVTNSTLSAANRMYGSRQIISDSKKGKNSRHLKHGLQDHGVALDNLAQGDELGVGAQEIQRSASCCAARAWSRLHSRRAY